jgi:hypothetical protein
MAMWSSGRRPASKARAGGARLLVRENLAVERKGYLPVVVDLTLSRETEVSAGTA